MKKIKGYLLAFWTAFLSILLFFYGLGIKLLFNLSTSFKMIEEDENIKSKIDENLVKSMTGMVTIIMLFINFVFIYFTSYFIYKLFI